MTVTSAGGRLLAERAAGPLDRRRRHPPQAGVRQALHEDPLLRERLRAALKAAPDMPRALSRLAMDRGGPRDLACIRDGVTAAAALARLLPGDSATNSPRRRRRSPRSMATSRTALSAALGDDLPLLKRDGGFVRPGPCARARRDAGAARRFRAASSPACRRATPKRRIRGRLGSSTTTSSAISSRCRRRTASGSLRRL